MANYLGVFAVGDSLARFLQNNYNAAAALPNSNLPATTFKVLSSLEIATEDQSNDLVVSIFLHRVTTNENFRAVTRLQDSPGEKPSLFLDLHYMITYWGTSAEAEQATLVWTMQQLAMNPILDSSILSLSTVNAGWDVTETVQFVPADLSLEDIFRIWDALGPKYRLSTSYVARVVRIDQTIVPGGPVLATRFAFEPSLP